MFSIRNILKIILVIQILFLNLIGQNLVSNGNFETYSACPSNSGQLNLATGWFVSGGSPDYFNACGSFGVRVPYTFTGYQNDCCGGVGMAGEYMLCSEYTPGDFVCREYMGTKLTDTLQAGHKYLVGMYVSRGNYNYSIATIGMLFTDTAVLLPNPQQDPMLIANPQVKGIAPLTDTMNWVLVQDTVTAIGNEAYLTIGNFNTTATSDTLWQPPNASLADGAAYYYIDGVSVYDVATLGINNIESTKAKINVYPNPTNNYLKINCNLSLVVCRLEDVLGNTIKTLELKSKEETIDISDLPEGIYFISLKTTEGVFTKKIIIQH